MYLLSLATASPESRYSQEDCYRIFENSNIQHRLRDRSKEIIRTVLLRDNGIHERGFCFPQIEDIFDADPQTLNSVFEQTAPLLGAKALARALKKAELSANSIDGLIVCTCTGYLCPGLSSFIAEKVDIPATCELTDIVGMGCGAAIPSMRTAYHRLLGDPGKTIAVVAVEVCSAAFYLDDNPGVIISACLFGDGAAAAIFSGENRESAAYCFDCFQNLHLPEQRSLLRFENANGALRNRLSLQVPSAAAKAVEQLWMEALDHDWTDASTRVLPHTGGRDVLDALKGVFPSRDFPESRKVLQKHGNLSSPTILYVLDEYLQNYPEAPSSRLWLTSFGAGFSAYACRARLAN